ncbi:hypothetical protein G4B88_025381 [Cannabis sativa]|uniref:Uncharacterized protein n=1 Tax=Cannabis sativa TaxID=3483 RepID=A0A7J6HSY3_CANSA|nr:hypothetical protein G4B88_025381 [Cannabis sativa]
MNRQVLFPSDQALQISAIGISSTHPIFLKLNCCEVGPIGAVDFFNTMEHDWSNSFKTRRVGRTTTKSFATGPPGKELFERGQMDLLADLKDIPKKA